MTGFKPVEPENRLRAGAHFLARGMAPSRKRSRDI